MIQSGSNAGKRMIEEMKRKNEDDTKRVQEAGGTSLVFNEEWDQIDSDDSQVKVAKPVNKFVAFFLNRMVWVLLVFLDFAILGVCCALLPGLLLYLFLAVNTIVAVLYMIQFVVSLCFLVPMTSRGPTDCTWAGGNDIIAMMATVGDFVLIIQLWTSTAFDPVQTSEAAKEQAFTTFLTMAALIRLMRLIRVYNFWFKVGRYHEIRVVSWLMFAEVEKEQKLEATEAGKPKVEGEFGDLFTPTATATTTTKRKSVRPTDNNPMWNSYNATGVVNAPPSIDPNSF
jgi:hypothetical protein